MVQISIELASAYVSLIPSSRGFRSAVERELGGTDATGFGEQAGEQYSGGFGSKLATSGLLIGGTFAAGLLKGTFDALDRGAQNDLLASQLGLDPLEAQRVGDVSSALYAGAWGDNLEEVNQAVRGVYAELEGQELSTDQLEKYTATALDLSKVMDADVNEVIRATTALLSNDLTADADVAFDTIAFGFQEAGVRGDDLLDTLSEYSNQFADLGISGEEATGLIIAGLEGGARSTDGAADAIKEAFLRISEGAAPTQEALSELGLDIGELQGLINNDQGATAFQSLAMALQDVESDTDAARIAQTLLGGTYEQVGLDGVRSMGDFREVLGDTTGTAQRLGDTLNDNLSTRIESLKRKGFQALADIAERFVIPALEGIVVAVENFGAGFSAVAGFVDRNLPVFVGLGAFIGSVAIPLFISWAATTIATLVPAFIAWAGAAGAAAIATIAANAPLILIAAAIGAVAAVFVYAYRNSETFRGFVDKLADVFKTKVIPAVKAVAGWIADNLIPALISAGSWIADNVIPVIGDFIGWLWDLHKAGFEVITGVIGFFGDIVDAVRDLPGQITDAAKNLWDGLLAPFERVVAAIKRVWNDTVGGFGVNIPGFLGFDGVSFTIPKLHSGGIIPGGANTEMLAILQGGEEVVDRRTRAALAGPDGSVVSGRTGGGSGVNIENLNVYNRPVLEELREAVSLRPVPVG